MSNDLENTTLVSNKLSKLKIFAILFSGLVLALLACGIYIYTQLQPIDQSSVDEVSIVVPPGTGIKKIALILQEEGLIRSPLIFRFYVSWTGVDKKIQAGSFKLSKADNLETIANKLTEGTEDVWITTLEGWRREEIAQYLAAQDLAYFSEDEFLNLTSDLEGQLFPDTYLVPREISTEAVVKLLRDNFEKKIVLGLATELENSNRSLEDNLIMASIVEREARDYEQMRHVAGILWNRIDIGMALQVDATLQYAGGYNSQTNTWWSPPLATDKETPSLFNTYTNPGLPPRPISNPGLNAIKATLDALEVDDLYYLHAPDGRMYYAETLEGHNANINRYLR